MKSKKWIQRNSQDIYVKKAKNEGYVSRSAFKLLEIENKFHFIIKSKNILELGSSPGGWSQVVCQINKKVKIDAFDLLDMRYTNKNIIFFKKDLIEFDFKSLNKKYDLILSDIAPNTIGHQATDHLRIISLIEDIILILNIIAQINSNFIFKILKGSEEKNLIYNLKKKFKYISYFKPRSSRSESSEIFIIAQEFIG
jgi:23S rRNA (uridine2552-2'-O)-methyltransferase